MATGKEIATFKGTIAAFSSDGARIATGDGLVARVWDSGTGKALIDLKGHADRIVSLRFSPDGTALLTGSADRTARLWDIRERR